MLVDEYNAQRNAARSRIYQAGVEYARRKRIEDERRNPEARRRAAIEVIMEARTEYLAARLSSAATEPKLGSLLNEVCALYGVHKGDIRGPRRTNGIVIPRHDFCYRAMTKTTRSLPAIGRFLGRDHTTVLHGAQMHAKRNGLPDPSLGRAVGRKRQTETSP